MLDNITMEPTHNKPKVSFNKQGSLLLEGRSFCESPDQLYKPLVMWCSLIDLTSVTLEVKLDYINTSSTKCLHDVLEALDKNEAIRALEVKWYCEEDDDEMYDLGRIFSSDCPKATFNFYETEETV